MNLANLPLRERGGNRPKHYLLLLGLLLFLGELSAQDIHASMFNRTSFNLNPALVGVFGGDLRILSNYRRQWKNVPVDYTTFTAGIEHKFGVRQDRSSYFTGGLLFNYDDAGDLSVTNSEIGLAGAYLCLLYTSPSPRD